MINDCPLILPSFPHQGQYNSPVWWQSALGWWIPFSPITFGDSEGDTRWKNQRPLGKPLNTQWVNLRSFCLAQTYWTSYTSDPKRLVEVIISKKRLERLWDPSWLKAGWCTSKYIHLVAWTRLVSQQKASWWFSLNPTRGVPSFHLWQMGSLAGAADPVASSLNGWCCHLVPVGEDGSLDAEGEGTVKGVSLTGEPAVGWQLVGRPVVCYP